MLVKLAGGRVYDPINGVDGGRPRPLDRGRPDRGGRPRAAVRPTTVIDVAGRVVMPGGIDLHSHIGGGKVNIARHDAARGAPRLPAPAPRRLPLRQRPLQPVHLQHRLRLRPHGLHHGVRAGDAGRERAAGPPGDGGHPAARQRRLRAARQRGPAAADALGRQRQGRRCATTSPGRCNASQALAVKIVNPGGISAFKCGRPPARPRRGGPALRRHAAPDPDRAGGCRDRARRAAPDPRPRLQPRRAGQQGHDARHDPRHGGAAASTSPTSSSTATGPRGRTTSRAGRPRSPSWSTRARTSRSTSGR